MWVPPPEMFSFDYYAGYHCNRFVYDHFLMFYTTQTNNKKI